MMHITLRQLRIFEAVARHLSFTQASQVLHITQPAVSMQVREMEELIGLPLFEQLGRRIYLTEAGEEMLAYTHTILQQLDEAESVMGELKGARRGRLKIGVVTSAYSFASQMLASFCKQHQSIHANFHVGNRENMLGLLMDNDIDLAIMGSPPRNLALVSQAFMKNPLVAIAAASHPLTTQTAITLERLVQEPFLLREQGSGDRLAMLRFFKEKAINYRVAAEINSNEAIKQGVEAGLGLAIVPLNTLRLELETKRLCILPVENLPIIRSWHIVHRQDKRLTGSILAFKDYILSNAHLFAEIGGREQAQGFTPAPSPYGLIQHDRAN